MLARRSTVIVTPAAAEDRRLASRDMFKLGMGIKDGELDEYIDFQIDAQSDAFSRECDRVFYRETLQDIFTTTDRDPWHYQPVRSLVLSRYPVVSIASITDASGMIDPTTYTTDLKTGIVRFHGCHRSWCPGDLTVQYIAGYLTPGQEGRDLPHEIEEAVLTMVRGAYKARGRDPAQRSQQSQAGTQSFWIGIPPDVQQAIDNHADARCA